MGAGEVTLGRVETRHRIQHPKRFPTRTLSNQREARFRIFIPSNVLLKRKVLAFLGNRGARVRAAERKRRVSVVVRSVFLSFFFEIFFSPLLNVYVCENFRAKIYDF